MGHVVRAKSQGTCPRRAAALPKQTGPLAPSMKPRPLSPFEKAVARVVRRIPRGTTLGYGQVALRAGKPGAARLAVRALHRLDDLPWWRVARSDGSLAPVVAFDQEQLLRAEGWRGPPRRAKQTPAPRRAAKTFSAKSVRPRVSD